MICCQQRRSFANFWFGAKHPRTYTASYTNTPNLNFHFPQNLKYFCVPESSYVVIFFMIIRILIVTTIVGTRDK